MFLRIRFSPSPLSLNDLKSSIICVKLPSYKIFLAYCTNTLLPKETLSVDFNIYGRQYAEFLM